MSNIVSELVFVLVMTTVGMVIGICTMELMFGR